MRPRPWLRVLLSLAIGGLMIGMMLGRLLAPAPTVPQLLGVEQQGEQLVLRFDHPAEVHTGQLEGALALQVSASGKAAEGQMRLGGLPLRWRIEPREKGLWITLLSIRPLQGGWDSEESAGEWRLRISPQPH